MSSNPSNEVKNVVLVHGGFVDGSGWAGVYNALKGDGYRVTIVQNPTISLADDVAVTKRAIAELNGPVILRPLVRRCRHHRSRQRSGRGGAGLYSAFADSGESVSASSRTRLRARRCRRSSSRDSYLS
jgi:hypothetical protein